MAEAAGVSGLPQRFTMGSSSAAHPTCAESSSRGELLTCLPYLLMFCFGYALVPRTLPSVSTSGICRSASRTRCRLLFRSMAAAGAVLFRMGSISNQLNAVLLPVRSLRTSVGGTYVAAAPADECGGRAVLLCRTTICLRGCQQSLCTAAVSHNGLHIAATADRTKVGAQRQSRTAAGRRSKATAVAAASSARLEIQSGGWVGTFREGMDVLPPH